MILSYCNFLTKKVYLCRHLRKMGEEEMTKTDIAFLMEEGVGNPHFELANR